MQIIKFSPSKYKILIIAKKLMSFSKNWLQKGLIPIIEIFCILSSYLKLEIDNWRENLSIVNKKSKIYTHSWEDHPQDRKELLSTNLLMNIASELMIFLQQFLKQRSNKLLLRKIRLNRKIHLKKIKYLQFTSN